MPRGQFRIYLGAGPGVGKTFAMLDEGQRRSRRGTDVVVGALDGQERPRTSALLHGLEVARPRDGGPGTGAGPGTPLPLDLAAVIARRPDVVLVDDLAHVDPPFDHGDTSTTDPDGPDRTGIARWTSVDRLLDEGIEVIGTVDIGDLESLRGAVTAVGGRGDRTSVPDRLVRAADQIHFVDQTPEALRRRLAHGNIFPLDEVDPATADVFRSDELAILRRVALSWMSDWVAEQIERHHPIPGAVDRWETRESVVVALTGAPSGVHVIRRAARLAGRQRSRLVGVHVRSIDADSHEVDEGLDAQKQLLSDLGGEYREVASGDVAAALVDVATDEHAGQLVLGSTRRSRWVALTRGSLIADVLRQSPVDVHVIGPEPGSATPGSAAAERVRAPRRSVFSPRRRLWAWFAAFVAPVVIVAVLSVDHPAVGLSTQLLLMVLAVAVAAVVGGARPALASAAVAFGLSNWFFIPPLHQFSVSSSEDRLSILVFLVVAVAVGSYVSASARRSAEALEARSDASTLASIAGAVATSADPLPALLDRLRDVFGANGAALFDRSEGPPKLIAASGADAPAGRESAERRLPVGANGELLLAGGPVRIVDRSVTTAFLDQLAVALEQRRLRAGEQEAAKVATANELRAALLAAVSHDLRTPLTAVKTAVSGLRQPDVEWPPEVRDELLETIEDGADRLSTLITNLLDLTRIQAGAVELRMESVRLDEVVHRALMGLGAVRVPVRVEIDDTIPGVLADPALLEHVVTNLVDNAVKWSPDGVEVLVDAAPVGDSVHLRVIDRGPGIPVEDRAEMLRPFRRLAGPGADEGAGLGLAVANGFASLMGVDLLIEDTPGAGATITLVFTRSTSPLVGPADA